MLNRYHFALSLLCALVFFVFAPAWSDEPAPAEPPATPAEEAAEESPDEENPTPQKPAEEEPAGEKPADPPAGNPSSEETPESETPADPGEAMPAEESAPAEPKKVSKKPAANETFDLKYRFKRGEMVRTEIVHRATVQTTIQGTSQTAETQSKSIKAWLVKDVGADGTITFVHSVESIEMRQKTQGRKEIRYNSLTDREVPAGYEDAAAAVGLPLTVVTMDSRGKILKRVEKRVQPMSVSTQMTMPLPDRPVAVGESWSTPIDIEVTLKDSSVRKICTRQRFALESVADDVATISVESQILTPINDPAIEAQLIQRLSAGTIRFDIAAGRVLSQQLDLDRNVIGFSGTASSMHYVTRFTEQLLKDAPPAKPGDVATGAPKEKEPAQPTNSAAKKKAPRR